MKDGTNDDVKYDTTNVMFFGAPFEVIRLRVMQVIYKNVRSEKFH